MTIYKLSIAQRKIFEIENPSPKIKSLLKIGKVKNTVYFDSLESANKYLIDHLENKIKETEKRLEDLKRELEQIKTA